MKQETYIHIIARKLYS